MDTIDFLTDFFDLRHTEHKEVFDSASVHIWDIFDGHLANYILANLAKFRGLFMQEEQRLDMPQISDRAHIGKNVIVGYGTVIEPFVNIIGPAIIGRNCVIRSCAYFRENVIVGDNVVVGHGTELKNSLLFDGVEVPHRNYVGDSVLGWKSHLAANVIISNTRIDRKHVRARVKGQIIDTGLRKFGAIIGDKTEVGSNATINPGIFIGKSCLIYANASVNQSLDSGHILKVRQAQEIVQKRNISLG